MILYEVVKLIMRVNTAGWGSHGFKQLSLYEETGNEKVLVSEEDVPEVCLPLPIYDNKGFPDHGLNR